MLVIFTTEICYSTGQDLENQECSVLFPFEKSFDLTKQVFTVSDTDHTCSVNVMYFVWAEMWLSHIALNTFRLMLKHPFISVRNQ